MVVWLFSLVARPEIADSDEDVSVSCDPELGAFMEIRAYQPVRSLAFVRISKDSHRQSSQDLCGYSHLSPGLERGTHRAEDLFVALEGNSLGSHEISNGVE